ncbi:hypothetical protein Tco_0494707 [Tanacetum coccineum]
MLGPGRYSQWRSCFLRYIDTKGNGEYLRKCIFEGPYKLTSVVIEVVVATVNSPEVPQHDEAETVHNMSAENKLYFQAEKELIFLTLTALEMKKFTSRDGESMESYYSRFYKLVNEFDKEQLGFGHYAKECRKPKRVKDYTYHKEKMMMCKQAEQGVPLQAEQADWLADTDEEIDEQELEAHYSFMAKIQEVLPEESSSTDQPLEHVQNHDENNVFANERRHSEQPESINDTYVLEKDDSNVTPDSSNICNNDNQVDQNAAECVDERAALANLIANLTLDTEENKMILKQLKKANASLTQELEKCKTNLDETSSVTPRPKRVEVLQIWCDIKGIHNHNTSINSGSLK